MASSPNCPRRVAVNIMRTLPRSFVSVCHGHSWGASVALGALALATGACSKGGAPATGVQAGSLALVSVESGALVDVYGLRRTSIGSVTSSLYQRDVLIGADIVDERSSRTGLRRDNEITYDFLSSNPDNLQPRLLITRTIGSAEFAAAFAALDDNVRRVTPGQFGQDTGVTPFSVVPRNAALRVTFSRDLGLDASFFYVTADATIVGVKNTEAVQLLRIVGDPNDGELRGDFQVLPARLIPRGNAIIVDPVLLGSEGVQLQVRNQAAGLPEAADQVGANLRLAIAIEGLLAIPGMRRDHEAELIGRNNGGQASIIRDFRSGHRADDTPQIKRGFRRDPLPLHIVGELLLYLERVEEVDEFTQLVTLYKEGIRHRIDAGDSLRIVALDGAATVLAITEIVADPGDSKDEAHTRVLVRREEALATADPRSIPGYPADRAAREPWLIQNAPRAVLLAQFESGDGQATSDDPQHFVRFSPQPIPDENGRVVANRNVSPFAAALVRFSKPVDLTSVRAQDSLFFASKPMLGLSGAAAIADFLAQTNMEPQSFVRDKFLTPHLIVGARFDEDGSQTTIRLQPPLGFYLDDVTRQPQNAAFRTCFLHILGGPDGIKDLPGNELDFLPAAGRVQDAMTIDFSLDAREVGGRPLFANNRVINVARRFAAIDEDENPSYFIADEIRQVGGAVNEKSYPLEDLFGAVSHVGGRLAARPTTRVAKVADDLNQQPPPPQNSDLRFCPESPAQVASAAASVRYGQPLQNPLNPYGCRLMTLWREIDMSLSRVDPYDFNLDVEEMHWAPHSARPITFDEFDRMSLFLGHSESRAENCVGATSALPTLGASGLQDTFANNYVRDLDLRGVPEPNGPRNPAPHAGYVDRYVVIDATLAFTEPNNINRFMPLPPLQKPYFVWRDETVAAQGGDSRASGDVNVSTRTFEPYIISPWLMGGGRYVTRTNQGLSLNVGRWITGRNYNIRARTPETFTQGLAGSIALPLLGDFQMHPDEVAFPAGRGYIASGANGWQIALAVQSSALPNFRVYSGGGVVNGRPRYVASGSPEWSRASGGLNPLNGSATPFGDNSFYWTQLDFLKRQTVVTAGFVDVLNPHRIDPAFLQNTDPRLGPYFPAGAAAVLPSSVAPLYTTLFEPPLDSLPGGTEIVAQYRGASIVDPRPWIATDCTFPYWTPRNQVRPDHINFPLDPRKAGDAAIRKYSDQFNARNQPRNHWVYPYNLHVTDWVDDLNTLTQATFLAQYAGPVDSFRPNEVRYFDWRFLMRNAVEATPPVTPELESFAVIYRLEDNR